MRHLQVLFCVLNSEQTNKASFLKKYTGMKQASILCMALFCTLCAGAQREASDFGTDFHVCL